MTDAPYPFPPEPEATAESSSSSPSGEFDSGSKRRLSLRRGSNNGRDEIKKHRESPHLRRSSRTDTTQQRDSADVSGGVDDLSKEAIGSGQRHEDVDPEPVQGVTTNTSVHEPSHDSKRVRRRSKEDHSSSLSSPRPPASPPAASFSSFEPVKRSRKFSPSGQITEKHHFVAKRPPSTGLPVHRSTFDPGPTSHPSLSPHPTASKVAISESSSSHSFSRPPRSLTATSPSSSTSIDSTSHVFLSAPAPSSLTAISSDAGYHYPSSRPSHPHHPHLPTPISAGSRSGSASASASGAQQPRSSMTSGWIMSEREQANVNQIDRTDREEEDEDQGRSSRRRLELDVDVSRPRSRHHDQSMKTEDPESQSAISSSYSSSRYSRPSQQGLSTSAPSRFPSPPPSFSLSSGRPLVQPPAKTQAAFVGKLYAMLEDEEIIKTGLIHWSPDGTIFTCPNPTEFAK
ncbi:hypothetical protein BD324DRAFT_15361 [Kockovaella imperatae]|uniref:Uncharacterized protein n=1 Tax=Kockovaella imperatae TaxID=4999 RepID=A0A1Y1URI7_9TREE|nr:hypothetical protein BD324DRAFT_15361 [Kockovaella imperatae]ORX40678.1 hypothetical protein BD324DRAFT_15361 [Kockovaella imperatae]